MAASSLPDVIFERIGNVGLITLSRPDALNALNLGMVQSIYPVLKQWESQTNLVIIRGAGPKAFCAGGDIKAVRKAGLKNEPEATLFFSNEYKLNHLIGTLNIPYVAIIHGITMGGGVGLSVHGKYRVATEKTLFAMPETAIGLFPDVGGSYFLPRLSGNLGTFLGLTGFRLKGLDVLKAGIATHFCDFDKLPELEKKLLALHNIDDLENVLNTFTQESQNISKEFSLQPHLDKIEKCFAFNSVEEIRISLKKDGSNWAIEQYSAMKKMSPTSMKITLKLIREGKQMSLKDCLEMEYRVVTRILKDHDFFEGVRAAVVDKDNKPIWLPSKLEDLSDKDIDAFFMPLPEEAELDLDEA